jgi:hypothetical protein
VLLASISPSWGYHYPHFINNNPSDMAVGHF